MVVVVAIFALLIIAFGLWGIVAPAGLLTFVSHWESYLGLWLGVLLRLAFGVALWSVAAESRFPVVLQTLGIVSVAAGLALPFMGLARFEEIITWWCHQSPGFTQLWAASAVAVGVVVLWAIG